MSSFKRDFSTDFHVEDPEFNERFEEVLDELVATCPIGRSNVGHGLRTRTS